MFAAKGEIPEFKCYHDSQELKVVSVVTEMVKDGSREWSVKELPVEIATISRVARICGEDPRIVYPRRRLDERCTIVE